VKPVPQAHHGGYWQQSSAAGQALAHWALKFLLIVTLERLERQQSNLHSPSTAQPSATQHKSAQHSRSGMACGQLASRAPCRLGLPLLLSCRTEQ
jgi:hypothetical protein